MANFTIIAWLESKPNAAPVATCKTQSWALAHYTAWFWRKNMELKVKIEEDE